MFKTVAYKIKNPTSTCNIDHPPEEPHKGILALCPDDYLVIDEAVCPRPQLLLLPLQVDGGFPRERNRVRVRQVSHVHPPNATQLHVAKAGELLGRQLVVLGPGGRELVLGARLALRLVEEGGLPRGGTENKIGVTILVDIGC
jgi:hypothetical protein